MRDAEDVTDELIRLLLDPTVTTAEARRQLGVDAARPGAGYRAIPCQRQDAGEARTYNESRAFVLFAG